jgi:NAD(P)-dependent dehydrogenase (short-subunit alcohol dehydrogenase family)
MSQLRFDGRAAVVTGAGRGLGREYAKLLASRGALVVVNDLGVEIDGLGRSLAPAEQVVQEIRAAGGTAVVNGDDITTDDGARSVIAAATESFGRLDILVNNAGLVKPALFEETDLDMYRTQFDVSFYGSVLTIRHAWSHLKKSKGNIVNISSSSILGIEVMAAYGAAKGAVYAFTRTLAINGARHGIRVNAVMPMGATRMAAASGETIPTDEIRHLIDRELAPSKVAPVVAFLAHENCPVTGKAFSAGRDRVALVFIGETLGFRKENLTVEDVAENFNKACDASTVLDFASNDEMVAYVLKLP